MRTLEQLRERKWEEIKEYRDDLLENGGYSTSQGWFHSDLKAQLNYEDLYKMKGQLSAMPPSSRMWKTMSGSFVLMTEVLVDEIFSSKTTQKMTNFAVAEQHKIALYLSNDPLNYDYSAGWTATYQG